MASAMLSIVRPLSRYTAAEKAASGLLPQASLAKRLSPSGLAWKPLAPERGGLGDVLLLDGLEFFGVDGDLRQIGHPWRPASAASVAVCHSGLPPTSKAEASLRGGLLE
jgi:hypothetical protein